MTSSRGAPAWTVRAARAGDAEGLVALAAELNALHEEPTNLFDVAAAHRDVFADDAPVEAAVAVDADDSPFGYALWCFGYESAYAARGAYLCDLYVRADGRRHGVGRALMRFVARSVARSGGCFVWWTRQPWNEDAARFYARLGAVDEPIHAHAVFDAPFEALVRDAPDGV